MNAPTTTPRLLRWLVATLLLLCVNMTMAAPATAPAPARAAPATTAPAPVDPRVAEAMRVLADPVIAQARVNAALQTLEKAGPAAAPAAQLVVKRIKYHDDLAARTVEAIGPAALPALQAALRGADSRQRDMFIALMSGMGAEAAPYLIAASKDRSIEARRVALTGLGKIEKPNAEVMEAVTAALKDEHAHLRRTAIVALLGWSGDDERAADLAIAAIREPKNARQMKDSMSAAGPHLWRRILPLLSDPDPDVRRCGVAYFRHAKAPAESAAEAIPLLEALQNDRNTFLQLDARQAIGLLRRKQEEAKAPPVPAPAPAGGAPAPAVDARDPQIEQAIRTLEDPNAGAAQHRAALKTLRGGAHTSAPATPAVVRMLSSVNATYALDTLAAIGSPAVPAVAAAIKDGSLKLHPDAVAQLRRGGGNGSPPLLIIIMKHPALRDLRAAALKPMSGQAPRHPEMLEVVLEALKDPDVAVRRSAVRTLGGWAPIDKRAAEAVVDALLNPELREEAIEGAARGMSHAWAKLVPLLEHADPAVRAAAVRAFSSTQVLPEGAREALDDVRAVQSRTADAAMKTELDAIVKRLTALADSPYGLPRRPRQIASAPARPPGTPPPPLTPDEIERLKTLFADPRHEKDAEKDAAIIRIRELGPAAEPLVPALDAILMAPEKGNEHSEVISALLAIRTPSTIAPLLKGTDEPGSVNRRIYQGLREHGEAAVEPLESAALDPNHKSRQDAILTLQHIGGPAAEAALARIAQQPVMPQDGEVAARVLETVRVRDPKYVIERILAGKTADMPSLSSQGPAAMKTAMVLLGHADPRVRKYGAGIAQTLRSQYHNQPAEQEKLIAIVKAHPKELNVAMADADPAVQDLVQRLAKMVGVDASSGDVAMIRTGQDPRARTEAMMRLARDKGEAVRPVLEEVLNGDGDMGVRRAAARAIVTINQGEASVIAGLRSDHDLIRIEAHQLAMQHGEGGWQTIFKAAAGPEIDARRRAQIVGGAGATDAARKAGVDIVNRRDPQLTLPALYLLAATGVGASHEGKAAAQVVAALLANPSAETREVAARVIGRSSPHGEAVVAGLLQSEDVVVRRLAAKVLAGDRDTHSSQKPHPAALAPLQAAVRDADAEVREHVAKALGRHAPAGLNEVIAMLNDPAPDVAVAAFFALDRGRQNQQGPPRLAQMWHEAFASAEQHANPAVARVAATLKAIRTANPIGKTNVPNVPLPPPPVADLLAILRDPQQSSWMKEHALLDLKRHGAAAAPAMAAITELLQKSPRPRTRQCAAQALGAAGAGSAQAAATLLAAIEDPDPAVMRSAMSALGDVGAAAAAALPRIVKIIETTERRQFIGQEDQWTREAALTALAGIGKPADAVAALAAANDTASIQALAEMGPAGAAAVPALTRHVKRGYDQLQLAMTNPDAASAFGENSSELEAARALGRMGPAAQQALPVLRDALDALPGKADETYARQVLRLAVERVEGVAPITSPDPEPP